MKRLPIPDIELKFKLHTFSDFTLWLFQEHPVKLYFSASELELEIHAARRRLPLPYEMRDLKYFPSALLPDE